MNVAVATSNVIPLVSRPLAENLIHHEQIVAMKQHAVIDHVEYINPTSITITKSRAGYLISRGETTCVTCKCEGNIIIAYRHNNECVGTVHYDVFHLSANTLKMMTVDHYCPKSLGGCDAKTNLRLMCAACNMKRGNKLTRKEAHTIVLAPHLYLSKKSPKVANFRGILSRKFPDLVSQFQWGDQSTYGGWEKGVFIALPDFLVYSMVDL